MPAAQSADGELRRAQREPGAGAGPRHHRAGLVSGRRVGRGLHRSRAHPKEIAYFDRGPIDSTKLVIGGYWSTYYYNGYIYGSEIARGLDVLKLTPTADLTQNEIDAANLVRFRELNVAGAAEAGVAGGVPGRARVSRSVGA